MKLYTNRISTGKPKSMDDILASIRKEKEPVVKTASVKEAEKTDEGPSSGQLDVEPLHQTGESTNQPKGSDAEDKKEAPSSGQPEAEGKLVNDPKVEKDSGDEKEIKEALTPAQEKLPDFIKDKIKAKEGDSGEEEEKGEEKEEEDKDCKDKAAETKEEVKEAKKEEEKVEEEIEEKKDEKEAGSPTQFVKVSNLDSKTKAWLSDYWKQIYPAEYVDAMVADK